MNTRRVFISYSWDHDAHIEWVYNLATRLVGDGIDVLFDQWDTPLGSDLPKFMESLTEADRVLVISSSSYVHKANTLQGGAGYEKRIMTAQIMRDLSSNRVVPVVRNNDTTELMPTFLDGVKYVDFRDDAKYEEKYRELIHDLYGRRVRPRPPLGPNPFGEDLTENAPTAAALSPGSLWQPLPAPVSTVWRKDVFRRDSGSFSSNTFIEIELVPTEVQRVEVRTLATISRELATLGRQRGLFSPTQALDSQSTPEASWVRIANDPKWVENGLLVTRQGQRGFWAALPRDDLGTVLDEADLRSQVARGLSLLGEISLNMPRRFAVSIALGPFGMISIGSVSALGTRSSSRSVGFNSEPVELPAEDSVSASRLASDANEIADEIVARVIAHFLSR